MAAPDITDQVVALADSGLGSPLNASLSDTTALNLVVQGWSSAQDYAQGAYVSAINLINGLSQVSDMLEDLPNIDPDLSQIVLDISGLDDLLGTLPTPPTNGFTFSEVPYSSQLLTDLRTVLDSWVNGASTGIAPAVELAIWERMRSKEVTAGMQKSGEALRSFSVRGFSKPQGALSVELQDAAQATQDNLVTAARDIAIKQADLEQSNRRFALEKAWDVENGLIQYTGQMAQRALDAARALQQMINEVYKVSVDGYLASTQAYKARVDAETSIFRARVDQNVAEANIRIEAAKANTQKMIAQVSLLTEALKAGAQSAASLAASALAAVNLSGGISDSQSVSASMSDSRSQSTSASVGATSSSVYNYTP